MSHHVHDFEEGAQPTIFGEAILISQRRGATQRVGRKLANKLLSLASFSHTLFYRS
jgi:hypothetical protein